MTEINTKTPVVVRTERGLSIGGTRKTIYQVMDFLKAYWPLEQIQEIMILTDEEIAGVMEYIETHQEEVEIEYQKVLEETEELRKYYEELNRDKIAQIAAKERSPEQQALWDKLQAWKARLAQEDDNDSN